MDDHARAFAENLLKNLDNSIELVWEVLPSDPFALENPVDLVPDSSPQQAFKLRTKTIVQDFVEYEEGGAGRVFEAPMHDDSLASDQLVR